MVPGPYVARKARCEAFSSQTSQTQPEDIIPSAAADMEDLSCEREPKDEVTSALRWEDIVCSCDVGILEEGDEVGGGGGDSPGGSYDIF
jgi:hypothetical protein